MRIESTAKCSMVLPHVTNRKFPNFKINKGMCLTVQKEEGMTKQLWSHKLCKIRAYVTKLERKVKMKINEIRKQLEQKFTELYVYIIIMIKIEEQG